MPVTAPSSPATIQPSASNPLSARRERLLARIQNARDLPALGAAVSRVVQMTSNDDGAINQLASFILSDPSLTLKVLNLANTVYFRAGSQIPVTTVSKAILILGFETVKTAALALMLVEKLESAAQMQHVRRELLRALVAGCAGRELTQRSIYQESEEASVAALFKNMGQMLLAIHDHALYAQIQETMQQSGCNEQQAALQCIGCDFHTLATEIMHNWALPDTLTAALLPLASENKAHSTNPANLTKLKAPADRASWVRMVAHCSAEIASAQQSADAEQRHKRLSQIQQQFQIALNLNESRFNELLQTVTTESQQLMQSLGLQNVTTPPKPLSKADSQMLSATTAGQPSIANQNHQIPAPTFENSVLAEFAMQDEPHSLQPNGFHASGKPHNARELLLAGLHEVTQTLANGKPKVNEIVMLVLETLYRCMGFRFATVCLIQPPTLMRARTALGEQAEPRLAGFRFEVGGQDLFNLALNNDADLMIADASDTKITKLLPTWHKQLLPDARSFIVLPLVVNKKPIGLFYADRNQPATEGVSAEETALIKSLKAQILAALRQ